MSDLERELQELGDRVSETIKPPSEMPERLFRRVRIRRVVTGATGAIIAGVLALTTLAAVGTFAPDSQDRARPQPQAESPSPTDEPSPGREDSCEGPDDGGADSVAGFRVTGKELEGDVDGDGRPDRVTLRENVQRPEACRRVLVVETAAGETMTAVVEPLEWPSPDPKLLLLAEIDGRSGLEPVVALSPGAVNRPGEVYTVLKGKLARMRLAGESPGPFPHLFPFYNEFPSGVDCTDSPGEIVETASQFAPGGDDSVYGITRTIYRSDRATFRPVNQEEFVVDCCNEEAKRRWPETADDPFRTCSGRVQ